MDRLEQTLGKAQLFPTAVLGLGATTLLPHLPPPVPAFSVQNCPSSLSFCCAQTLTHPALLPLLAFLCNFNLREVSPDSRATSFTAHGKTFETNICTSCFFTFWLGPCLLCYPVLLIIESLFI